LALRPDMPEAYIGLASNFERTNQEHRFDQLRDEAAAARAEAQVLDYIDALRFRRANQFEDALAAIDRAGELPLAGHSRPVRGAILDRLKRYDEAFENRAIARVNMPTSSKLHSTASAPAGSTRGRRHCRRLGTELPCSSEAFRALERLCLIPC
jgi:predicted component of type VI protein secretion system